MATTRTTRRRTSARTSTPRSTGAASLDRLNASLEAAQKALTDLGSNLGRGGRDLLKDVQKLLGDARRDTVRLNRSLIADLNHLQKTVTGRQGRPRAGQRRGTTARASTRKTGGAARSRSSRSTGSTRSASK